MVIKLLAALAGLAAGAQDPSGVDAFQPQGFVATLTVPIEAPVAEVFDAATGDITGWWDHSFWPDPAEMVIEPRFDGRFYERFEAGSENGSLHARVIFVNAPTQLRLHGPLGLSGRAVDLVSSWQLEEADGGAATDFTVELHMSGEVDAELAGVVRGVWQHFIAERLKPYVEAGCHRAPDTPCAAFEN
ncbi:MAG: SRPBCC domain-containing protein [Pseudomonadota bacterium]|nr:SRPBCC domain-containing protein [Pseudomonadota bacterium]